MQKDPFALDESGTPLHYNSSRNASIRHFILTKVLKIILNENFQKNIFSHVAGFGRFHLSHRGYPFGPIFETVSVFVQIRTVGVF